MRVSSTILAVFAGAMAMGCSSSSSGGGGSPSDPFVGTWQCTGTSTNTQTEPMASTTTSTTMASAVITDNGSGSVTVIRTPENDGGGSPPCTEPFTLDPDVATLSGKTPFTCPTAVSSITQTFTSAVFTIGANGTTYTTNVSYSESGTNAAGAQYQSTGTATSTCTKS